MNVKKYYICHIKPLVNTIKDDNFLNKKNAKLQNKYAVEIMEIQEKHR